MPRPRSFAFSALTVIKFLDASARVSASAVRRRRHTGVRPSGVRTAGPHGACPLRALAVPWVLPPPLPVTPCGCGTSGRAVRSRPPSPVTWWFGVGPRLPSRSAGLSGRRARGTCRVLGWVPGPARRQASSAAAARRDVGGRLCSGVVLRLRPPGLWAAASRRLVPWRRPVPGSLLSPQLPRGACRAEPSYVPSPVGVQADWAPSPSGRRRVSAARAVARPAGPLQPAGRTVLPPVPSSVPNRCVDGPQPLPPTDLGSAACLESWTFLPVDVTSSAQCLQSRWKAAGFAAAWSGPPGSGHAGSSGLRPRCHLGTWSGSVALGYFRLLKPPSTCSDCQLCDRGVQRRGCSPRLHPPC